MLQLFFQSLFAFIFIISFIVFIHEFGHYIVARFNKVKVEEFSIGFGKKIFGFYDKNKTLWKFCLIPFGGYVKMYGDRNAASMTDLEAVEKMSDEQKKQSFIYKTVWQRIAIVAAGPIANFILGIIIFTILFRINGINQASTIISEVKNDSPAYHAGLLKGDEILSIDNKRVKNFNDIISIISINVGDPIKLNIRRDSKIIDVKLTPVKMKRKDFAGNDIFIPIIGVTSSKVTNIDLNIFQSFYHSTIKTYDIAGSILKTLSQLIVGDRSIKELGGPVKIAKYSGKTFELGFFMILWFSALISINLGVINLLPIPVLDGGHLLFYAIEAITGKPVPVKYQKIGFQIGFSIIITLMLFTTFNDINQIIKK